MTRDPGDPPVEGVDECTAYRQDGMAGVEHLRETKQALRPVGRRPSSDPALDVAPFDGSKHELTVDGRAYVVSDAGLRAFVIAALDQLDGRAEA